ncbi:hypothetical protein F511_11716 [Dorcoceras hygrometricum]|uniref:Uncharacterized protein n=1 Tax=Dorcoceras hygrometricum TaxID=472368 RepID=A0A2Z7CAK4_9LAMI|nr:hypothetical protein F511_11716 [Dorcoceras hygrometricum]
MNFVKTSVTHDVCESVKYDDQFTGQLNHKGKKGIGYVKPENCKPNWLTNRLEKDKVKVVPKSSIPNQQRCGSTKAKYVWIKVQSKRDLNGRAAIPHSHLPAGIVATMRRVVNYHSSWARQQQVELLYASVNPGSTAGRGFNPAGGAPGGG